jgi:hypothetical protein
MALKDGDKPQTQTRRKTMKKFYGVRFLGGNRTCTTGTPNQVTGRMAATKSECRKLRLGDSVEEFDELLEWAESSRYDD